MLIKSPKISVLRQSRMVLFFIKYFEFLDETFVEKKQHIEDAKYAIKHHSLNFHNRRCGSNLKLDLYLTI